MGLILDLSEDACDLMLVDLLWQSLPITAKECGVGSSLWFIRYNFILSYFPVICIKSVIFSAVSSTNKIDLNVTEMLLNLKLYSHKANHIIV